MYGPTRYDWKGNTRVNILIGPILFDIHFVIIWDEPGVTSRATYPYETFARLLIYDLFW